MNPYPNNPRRSPIQKSKEQETKEKELKTRLSLEKPILEWTQAYVDEEIKKCDSIGGLQLDLRDPEAVIRQIAALKIVKNHLLRIKGEVEKRMNMVE